MFESLKFQLDFEQNKFWSVYPIKASFNLNVIEIYAEMNVS